jgi:predicted metal-binding protein
MDSGYGCPGEWRCLKAAAMGEGNFETFSQVIPFLKCECPGRSLASNMGMAIELSEMKSDVIHLGTCLANARPGCPSTNAEPMAKALEANTGVKVVVGRHDYH